MTLTMMCRLSICLFLTLVSATNSYAQQSLPLCAFLDRLVLAGEKNFEDLRGPFDFSLSRYDGTLHTPDFTTCFTSVDGSSKNYSCQRRLPDDAVAARAVWSSVSEAAKTCFTGRSRVSYRAERTLIFKTQPHGAEVKVSHQRMERVHGSFYMLSVQVDVTDP